MHGFQQRERAICVLGNKMLTMRLQATSLPLLLLESLGNTGTLKQLMRDGETIDEVLNRGRVSAVCCPDVYVCSHELLAGISLDQCARL
jgi:hypothetical protein